MQRTDREKSDFLTVITLHVCVFRKRGKVFSRVMPRVVSVLKELTPYLNPLYAKTKKSESFKTKKKSFTFFQFRI